jgi:hypothetical protein
MTVIEAALRDDGSEASNAISSEVKAAIADSRQILIQAAKETSYAVIWILCLPAVLLVFAIACVLYSFFA